MFKHLKVLTLNRTTITIVNILYMGWCIHIYMSLKISEHVLFLSSRLLTLPEHSCSLHVCFPLLLYTHIIHLKLLQKTDNSNMCSIMFIFYLDTWYRYMFAKVANLLFYTKTKQKYIIWIFLRITHLWFTTRFVTLIRWITARRTISGFRRGSVSRNSASTRWGWWWLSPK